MDQGAVLNSTTGALHGCIVSLITILGFCLPLKFANASPFETNYDSMLMTLFIMDSVIYFGSLAFMIIQVARNNADIGEFMNKISLLFGSLAFVLELLILVQPFGWIVLFIWSICFLRVVTNSYQLLKTLYGSAIAGLHHRSRELKQKLIELGDHSILSNAFLVLARL